jgi:hypothetical protein
MLAFVMCLTGTPSGASSVICSFERSTGFMYKGSEWLTSSFYPEASFMLTFDENDQLIPTSLGKAFFGVGVSCTKSDALSTVSCSTANGEYVLFNTRTLRGAVARTFGATMNGPRRDTVSVEMFSCG